METKIKLYSVLVITVFSILCIFSSCRLFDDYLKVDDVHGNKIVFKNETTHTIHFEWRKKANASEISMDYPISVGGCHEYQGNDNVYDLLKETINTNFLLKVSNDSKTLEYDELELQSLSENIHSIINLNSWVKDYYTFENDTFDILMFTFTDKDFE